MALQEHPKITEVTRSMTQVPFNDFEMYHNPNFTGSPERGGTCIFLTNEFIRRLPPDQQVKVIGAINQVHYATILDIDGTDYFYDPFLRMLEPVELPQVRHEQIEFDGNPRDKIKSVRWRLYLHKKRGKQTLRVDEIKRINDRRTETLKHMYRRRLDSVTPMSEFDLTYERKSSLDIEVYEEINGVLRAFSFRYRLAFENVPMSAYSSGGVAGHSDYIGGDADINYGAQAFRDNLAPILGRLNMEYDEFMEYVEHAAHVRRMLRKQILGIDY